MLFVFVYKEDGLFTLFLLHPHYFPICRGGPAFCYVPLCEVIIVMAWKLVFSLDYNDQNMNIIFGGIIENITIT